jgi:HIP---CoA ligase
MDDKIWETIPQWVENAAERFADIEAISETTDEGDISLTYGELVERIRVASRALMASGIERGDRVAIWAPNIYEFVVCALSVHCAGAVLVPINTRFKGSEAAFVIQRSKARLLFTVSEFLDIDYVAMLEGQEGLESLDEIVVIRGEPTAASRDSARSAAIVTFDTFIDRASSVTEEAGIERETSVKRDDLCHILFTSGTTGKPKGVMLEHGPVCALYFNLSKLFDMREGDRQLVVLPFFHSFGLHVGMLCSLMRGITLLPHLVFEPEVVMARIESDRVSLFPGPPTVFQAILESPERGRYALESLRSVTIGGAGFPPVLVERIHDELGIERVQSGYGLTEASGTVTLSYPPASAEVIAQTTGIPVPGVELRIVDDDGSDVVEGEPGEICVRSYAMMRGYLDDPEETANTVDSEGWLHTGDIGLIRSDGNLVVTDRKKDMYSIGGFNAYPAEIEATLAKHPGIAQVAVIGVPDSLMGEVGMAYVIPVAGTTTTSDEIIAWSRERLANYKVPRHVEFVSEFPLNATGKVLKMDLRAQAAEALRHSEDG